MSIFDRLPSYVSDGHDFDECRSNTNASNPTCNENNTSLPKSKKHKYHRWSKAKQCTLL